MASSFATDCTKCFGTKDLYLILQITQAQKANLTAGDVKKAYYKQSMLWHPDRFSGSTEKEREDATCRFQIVSKAYGILSDEEKRRVYDATGELDDDAYDFSDDTDWTELWSSMFKPVTKKDVDDFYAKYLGSEEEERDLVKTYNRADGDMNMILEVFIGGDDEEAVRFKLQDLIARGVIQPLPKFVNEPESERIKRQKAREKSRRDYDKMVAREAAKAGKPAEDFDLFAAMQEQRKKRETQSSNFFASIEAKYCKPKPQKAIKAGKVAKKAKK